MKATYCSLIIGCTLLLMANHSIAATAHGADSGKDDGTSYNPQQAAQQRWQQQHDAQVQAARERIQGILNANSQGQRNLNNVFDQIRATIEQQEQEREAREELRQLQEEAREQQEEWRSEQKEQQEEFRRQTTKRL